MKISSGVNLNSITYSNELKTQNESQKMETYNNTDIVNISKEGVSKWQEYLSKKNDSLYQMEESGAVELDSTGADVWSQDLSMLCYLNLLLMKFSLINRLLPLVLLHSSTDNNTS